jgi:hypothetical protein
MYYFIGEGEFLASEDRILTVPFQFDLIQLLPKCQQIEMFFLMFGKGKVFVNEAVFIYHFLE